jgi:hypothetical protein
MFGLANAHLLNDMPTNELYAFYGHYCHDAAFKLCTEGPDAAYSACAQGLFDGIISPIRAPVSVHNYEKFISSLELRWAHPPSHPNTRIQTASVATLSGEFVQPKTKVVVKKKVAKQSSRPLVVTKNRPSIHFFPPLKIGGVDGEPARLSTDTTLCSWVALAAIQTLSEFSEAAFEGMTTLAAITILPVPVGGRFDAPQIKVTPTGYNSTRKLEDSVKDILSIVHKEKPDFFDLDFCMDTIKNKTFPEAFNRLALLYSVAEVPAKQLARSFDASLTKVDTFGKVPLFAPGVGVYTAVTPSTNQSSTLYLCYNRDGSTPEPTEQHVRVVPLREIQDFSVRNLRLALIEKYKMCLYCEGLMPTGCQVPKASCWTSKKSEQLNVLAASI